MDGQIGRKWIKTQFDDLTFVADNFVNFCSTVRLHFFILKGFEGLGVHRALDGGYFVLVYIWVVDFSYFFGAFLDGWVIITN